MDGGENVKFSDKSDCVECRGLSHVVHIPTENTCAEHSGFITAWVVEFEGAKVVFDNLEDAIEHTRNHLSEMLESSECLITLSQKPMSKKEFDKLKEFDGY